MTTPTQVAEDLYFKMKPGAKDAFLSYIANRTPADLQSVMRTVVANDIGNFFQAPVIVDAPFAYQENTKLVCTGGNWTDDPDSKSFQWKKAGVNVIGATAAEYIVQGIDIGASFTCDVTATNVAGSATSTSNAVVAIAPV